MYTQLSLTAGAVSLLRRRPPDIAAADGWGATCLLSALAVSHLLVLERHGLCPDNFVLYGELSCRSSDDIVS